MDPRERDELASLLAFMIDEMLSIKAKNEATRRFNNWAKLVAQLKKEQEAGAEKLRANIHGPALKPSPCSCCSCRRY